MRKICFTAILTAILTTVILTGVGAYVAGGFFVDMTLRRGTIGSPQAPPAVFRSVIEGNGRPIRKAERPRFSSEDWQLRSFDGLRLQATRFFPEEESHRWVVIVHGYSLGQSYVWDYAEHYLQHGYQVLTPDMRASGRSEGRYITMGARESRDIIDWARLIRQRDPQAKIVLHGVSMGAAAVLLAGAGAPPGVAAIVEDSSYTGLYQIFAQELAALFDLPAFPVLDFADLICQRRAGFSFSEAAPLRAVIDIRLPVLFIHGNADKLVPYAMMQELYDSCSAPVKEKYTAQGFPHGVACQDKGYYPAVFEFTDRFTFGEE